MVKMSNRWPVVGALAVAGLLVGCKEDSLTQITLAITSETKVPAEISDLQLVVTDGLGSVVHDVTYDVSTQSFFPTTLALIPRDGDSLSRPVEVTVRATKGDTLMVLRRAVVSYIEERTLLLPLSLRMACFSIDSCKANETCAGGLCVPAEIDGATLLDFKPQFVFGSEPGSDCFDEDTCLSTVTETPVDKDSCEFTIPADGEGKANVAIEWWTAQGRMINLEGEDEREGWKRVSPTRGILAKGVCKLLHEDPKLNPNAAARAFVSTSCPPKRGNQPYCGGGVGVALKAP